MGVPGVQLDPGGIDFQGSLFQCLQVLQVVIKSGKQKYLQPDLAPILPAKIDQAFYIAGYQQLTAGSVYLA